MNWLTLKLLSRILYNQYKLKRKVTKMASALEALQAKLAEVNTLVDEIVSDIQTLKENIANNTLTPEQINAEFGNIVSRLTQIGSEQ